MFVTPRLALVGLLGLSSMLSASASAAAKANAGAAKQIAALAKDMRAGVYGTNGDLLAAEVTVVGKIGQQRTVRELSYGQGRDVSQKIAVTGLGAQGIFKGVALGSVSTHDFGNLEGKAFDRAVAQRIAADRIMISYDHGPGTPVKPLVKGLRSLAVTQIPVSLPLKKGGVTRLIYDRTDARGNTVGASGAYTGRVVELVWDGK